MMLTLANAPVSYGVFEMTVGTGHYLPPPERLLDEVAAAGYVGIDLGPLGYLGTGTQLSDRLAERGLGLAGAYVSLPFADAAPLDTGMAELEQILGAFDAVHGNIPGPPPRPTLASAGSESHVARPGQSEADHSIGFDDAQWEAFGVGLRRVVSYCRQRGYEPTFHHHAGTYVEAPWEIDRVLELSDIGLCLDTGHLLVGGGDPVTAMTRWATRINQVHIKDAHTALMAEIVASGGSARDIWSRGVFCPLGQGDLNLDGVLEAIREIGYEGWIVVEQDVLLDDPNRFERAVADQRGNRLLLKERGL